MSNRTPPFRADHVGSLLRKASVKDARHRFYDQHGASREELVAAEDEAIREAVALQEDVGLPVATDGEIRRSFWHYDFMRELTGFDFVERNVVTGINFKGANTKPIFPTVTGPLDFPDDHPMLDHFRFLASVTKVMPKISIPGPAAATFAWRRKTLPTRPIATISS